MTMLCEDAQAQLTALHDGELAEDTRARVEAHLAGCPDCREERQALAAALALADSWQEDAESNLWPAVAGQLPLAPAPELLDELRALRAEMQVLRLEMADLRRQLAARPPDLPRRPAAPLFPYTTPTDSRLRLV